MGGDGKGGKRRSGYADFAQVHAEVTGKIGGKRGPADGLLGLQDDCWTRIAPDLARSRGSYLAALGEEAPYLDCCGFFGTGPLAFDHPSLTGDEYRERLYQAARYRISLSDFWPEEMAHFVRAFREVVGEPYYLPWLFLVEGGALACENALKAAFDWKVRTNIRKGLIHGDVSEERRPLGTRVISFERAFHGRSGYTLSLTHTRSEKYKFFPKFDWFRIDPPFERYDNEHNVINAEEVRGQQERAITGIKRILRQYPDDVAAIIVEPMQAEGGDRYLPVSFFHELRALCDENDMILIYDEIQVGFGSAGRMWMHEYFGEKARPDIVTFAKKGQLAGILASYERFQTVDSVFGSASESLSRINSTWGGNPADVVRSTAILQAIHNQRIDGRTLLEHVRYAGDELLHRLQDLCRRYPTLIENPRGCGLLAAFDVRDPAWRGPLWEEIWKERLLSLVCGTQGIRFRPHLDMTIEEVEDATARLDRALQRFAGSVARR